MCGMVFSAAAIIPMRIQRGDVMETGYLLGQMEETIYELDMAEIPDELVETEDEYQLWVSGWWVFVPALGLNLREGSFCLYDAAEGEYLPDFSVTVIYAADSLEADQEDTEEAGCGWLYYEQGGFAGTLTNWLGGKIQIREIERMKCFLHTPEEQAESNLTK